MADPPWPVKRPNGWHATKNSVAQPYPTMLEAEIAALPVPDLAAESAWLFCWTVNAFVETAYRVVRAWEFRPVTLLTWCKTPRGVGPGSAFPTTTEFIILRSTGYPKFGSVASHRHVLVHMAARRSVREAGRIP